MVLQAPGCQGLSFYPVPIGQDGLASAEVDVGGCEVLQAIVGAVVVLVLDKGADLLLQSAWQVGVLE